MAVIKENYLFPIYCVDADPIDNEKNFYATGTDIVDTLQNADLYVKKTGDDMTGHLNFVKSSDNQAHLRIKTNEALDDYTTNIVACNSGKLRLRTTTDNTGQTSGNWQTHLQISVEQHNVGDETLERKTNITCLSTPSYPHHAANKWYVDDSTTRTKEELEAQI